MLATIEQVVTEIEVSRGEVTAWIERRWVRPLEEDGRYLFDEADRARIKLIAELSRDLPGTAKQTGARNKNPKNQLRSPNDARPTSHQRKSPAPRKGLHPEECAPARVSKDEAPAKRARRRR